jgi:hypothetical protein
VVSNSQQEQQSFVPNCGKNLRDTAIDDTSIIQSKELEDENGEVRKEEEDEEEEEVVAPDATTITAANTPNYSYGIMLEETVEQILKGEGYSTERRKKLVGKSNTENEIDILAKKGNKILAVECKNYAYFI